METLLFGKILTIIGFVLVMSYLFWMIIRGVASDRRMHKIIKERMRLRAEALAPSNMPAPLKRAGNQFSRRAQPFIDAIDAGCGRHG